jgi:hypothetical protein
MSWEDVACFVFLTTAGEDTTDTPSLFLMSTFRLIFVFCLQESTVSYNTGDGPFSPFGRRAVMVNEDEHFMMHLLLGAGVEIDRCLI